MDQLSNHVYVKFEFEAIHQKNHAVPGEWYEVRPHLHIFTVEAWKNAGSVHTNVSAHLLRRSMLEWIQKEQFQDDTHGSGALDIEFFTCGGLATLLSKQFILDRCRVMDTHGTGADLQFTHDS